MWPRPITEVAATFLKDWCAFAYVSGIRILTTLANTLVAHRRVQEVLLPLTDGPVRPGKIRRSARYGLLTTTQTEAHGQRRTLQS